GPAGALSNPGARDRRRGPSAAAGAVEFPAQALRRHRADRRDCHLAKMRFLIASLVLLAGQACAQEPYPSRPVRVVANFAIGGAIDAVARVVSAKLAESMGQQFVVDNRPGAGGNIGADAVAKSRPDGYTLLFTLDTTLTVNPSLYSGRLPFDPAKDFAPITLAAAAPLVLLTHPALPAQDVAQFVALARARGGSLKFASGGSGS